MSQATAYEQYMLELINRDRAENGNLQPLAFNPALIDAAQGHTNWMLANGVFSHTGANGSDPGTRMSQAGYVFSGASGWGENIAWMTTSSAGLEADVAQLETNLMNSPPHRANLLNGSFKEVGVGIETGGYQGQNSAFVTQDFAYSSGDSFLTGVAYEDTNGDKFYDVGEGLAKVTVTAVNAATGQSFTTAGNDAGGYELQLAAGTYHVTFSDGVHQATTVNETIGSQNVEADWVSPALSSTPPSPPSPPSSPSSPSGPGGSTSTHDYLGDGHAQILIGNANNGDVVTGEVSNGQLSYATVASLGSEWKFAPGAGDFLGQGHDQFLVENGANGDLDIGSVTNGQTTYTHIGTLGSEWSVVGTGTYNGAGTSDFLMVNQNNGSVDVGAVSNGKAAYTQVASLGSEWKVVGSGDFLGQGHDQFLMENGNNGAVTVGSVSNGQTSYTTVAQLGSEWKFEGAGDFLGDGKSQFLLENSNNGDVAVGEVGSNGQVTYTTVASLGSEWKITGAADLQGQGHDQFVLQNSNNGSVDVANVVGGHAQFTQVGSLGSEWSFHM